MKIGPKASFPCMFTVLEARGKPFSSLFYRPQHLFDNGMALEERVPRSRQRELLFTSKMDPETSRLLAQISQKALIFVGFRGISRDFPSFLLIFLGFRWLALAFHYVIDCFNGLFGRHAS